MRTIVPLVVTAILLFLGVGNEVTHGWVSESAGVGHHHALDHGGIHCVAHDDPDAGGAHVEHVHGSGLRTHEEAEHLECPGEHGEADVEAVP